MKLLSTLQSIATALALAAGSTAALAAPVLTIDDPTDAMAPIVIVDNGVGDLNPLDGLIMAALPGLGSWTSVMAIATSKPLTGSDTKPDMSVNLVGTTGTTGSQLILSFSDDNFVGNINGPAVVSATGIESDVDYSVYGGQSNNLFDTSNLIGIGCSAGFTSCSASNNTGFAPTADPYSLTHILSIVSTSSTPFGTTIISAGAFSVPVPASLALFGLGLLGMGLFAKRSRPTH